MPVGCGELTFPVAARMTAPSNLRVIIQKTHGSAIEVCGELFVTHAIHRLGQYNNTPVGCGELAVPVDALMLPSIFSNLRVNNQDKSMPNSQLSQLKNCYNPTYNHTTAHISKPILALWFVMFRLYSITSYIFVLKE